MTGALYNDNEPFAADWLEELIRNGHIAQGRVDRRSITDLTAADLAGSGQRHFFAGIGGWSHALRLADVPDDASVWTGSCPCQPFSDAGQGGGTSDPRHLWPAWFALIRQQRPPVIFGEQVASAAGLGWLDAVSADLERCGYAVGAADLCAAGVGAPHIRQRLFFVAYADGEPGRLLLRAWRSRRENAQARRCGQDGGVAYPAGERRLGREGVIPPRPDEPDAPGGSEGGALADAARDRRTKRGDASSPRRGSGSGVAATHGGGEDGALAYPAGERRGRRRKRTAPRRQAIEPSGHGTSGGVADGDRPGLEVRRQQQARRQRAAAERGRALGLLGDPGRIGARGDSRAVTGPEADSAGGGKVHRTDGDIPVAAGATGGFWSAADWILCRDPSGRAPVARPVEPGTFPLAHGVPHRVGLLSGYGNAIVPQAAAAFITAALDALSQEEATI